MNDKKAEMQERHEEHGIHRLSVQIEIAIKYLKRSGLTKEQAKAKIKEIVDNI